MVKVDLAYCTPNILGLIEACGRVCYRSEGMIKPGSAEKIVTSVVKSGHESVIEHSNIIMHIEYQTEGSNQTHLRWLDSLLDFFLIKGLLTVVAPFNEDARLIGGNVRMYKDMVRVAYEKGILHNRIVSQIILNLRRFPPELFVDMLHIIYGVHSIEEAKEIDFSAYLPCEFTPIASGDVAEQIKKPIEFGDDCLLMNIDMDEETVRDDFCLSYAITPKDLDSLLTATVIVKMSRSGSHQEVRHRIAGYSQESQRYVDLVNRFEYLRPDEIDPNQIFPIEMTADFPYDIVYLTYDQMIEVEKCFYDALRSAGLKPEVAREVLPNACATKIAVTRTMKEWRKYFSLRGEKHAQLPIRKRACEEFALFSEKGFFPDLQLGEEYTITSIFDK